MVEPTTKAKRDTVYPSHPAQDEDPHQDVVDWELTEDNLPEGSTLSGNKAPPGRLPRG